MSFETAILDGAVGIVTGILTAALLYGGKRLFETVVLPFYREVRYQGVKLEGHWFGMEDDKDEASSSELKLFIEQSAHDITGTFQLRHASRLKNFDLNFKIVGYIWEGYVTLNLMPADRQITSYASGLLKVSGGGISLVGHMAYRHADNDCVDTLPIFLLRGSRATVRQQIIKYKAEASLPNRNAEPVTEGEKQPVPDCEATSA